jgi:flagellar basal body P-ring formation protein FlgA
LAYVNRNPFARDASAVIGMAARRTLARGRPVPLGDLAAPFLVKEGDVVSAEFTSGALRIAVVLSALQSGSAGDIVRLRNRETGLVVSGTVSGPGQVVITP